MSRDPLEMANELVEKSSEALVGSVDDDGYPNIKAMFSPRERQGIKEFYFTTNSSSLRVSQFSKNPKASIYYYGGGRGLMLTGTMEVLHDREAKERIWREGDDRYYRQGVTDPDYCVIRFVSESGRLYENLASTDFAIE